MITTIKPYKQSLSSSCLTACLLILLKAKGIGFTKADEQSLTLKGAQRSHAFYVTGVPAEVSRYYKIKIKVLADNKFFTNVLKKSFAKDKNIAVEHKPITTKLIKQLLETQPVICHIDDHALGDYSHASHFIVIEKASGNTFTIIDPWYGKRKIIKEATLTEAIQDLKSHIKMCPLLFLI